MTQLHVNKNHVNLSVKRTQKNQTAKYSKTKLKQEQSPPMTYWQEMNQVYSNKNTVFSAHRVTNRIKKQILV